MTEMPFQLTWLPDVLMSAGLKVAQVPGWKDRGHGDMDQINGVMCHHTGGSPNGNMPSLHIITHGKSPLKGPLAQLGLGRDGTYYVIAAGRAFHAGRGEWLGVRRGNSHFIAIEAENTGFIHGPRRDFPWPEVQMDAYRRGVAAILGHIGADPIMCCGHKEYRLPKGMLGPDPSFDMNVFRQQVGEILAGTAPEPVRIAAATADGKRHTLRRGDSGKHVEDIQGLIGVKVDGDFGSRTEAAVRQFQRDAGLVPDGIVGPRTHAALSD
jgi:peptidoglycan hydrolase-like protein with peptidoglycan-binding domain